jgi:signal peptidase
VLSIGPRFAPFETYIVLSGSMEPLIHVGAVEVVRPVPPERLQVGDIITYRRIDEPDVTVTHRVTQIAPSDAGTLLRTKGDVNETEDPWELQLRGTAWKHMFSVPYAGFVFVFAQTATGRWLTLMLPAGVLAALWLRGIWGGKRPGA